MSIDYYTSLSHININHSKLTHSSFRFWSPKRYALRFRLICLMAILLAFFTNFTIFLVIQNLVILWFNLQQIFPCGWWENYDLRVIFAPIDNIKLYLELTFVAFYLFVGLFCFFWISGLSCSYSRLLTSLTVSSSLALLLLMLGLLLMLLLGESRLPMFSDSPILYNACCKYSTYFLVMDLRHWNGSCPCFVLSSVAWCLKIYQHL